jgi:hypothetical protein
VTAAARKDLIQFCLGPLALETGHGSPIPNEATADLIVMPCCRSSASESVCVVPASALPRLSMTPVAYRSRSVSVV